jgi:hypothetical protein
LPAVPVVDSVPLIVAEPAKVTDRTPAEGVGADTEKLLIVIEPVPSNDVVALSVPVETML